MTRLTQKGFTLIELLIVIVIIGILAGIVIAVIDPAASQTKAEQAVVSANVNKACLALFACANTAQDATGCDTRGEIGIATTITDGLTDSVYALDDATSAEVDMTPPAAAGATIFFTGTHDDTVAANSECRYECSYDFANDVADPMAPVDPADCSVQ